MIERITESEAVCSPLGKRLFVPRKQDQAMASPLRVCYVIPSIDTPRAGMERHLLQLLRSLDRDVFDPLLVLLRPSPWTRECDGADVPTRILDIPSLWSPKSWIGVLRLARIMRRHRAEVVELYAVEGAENGGPESSADCTSMGQSVVG